LAALMRHINGRHSAAFRAGDRYPDGEQGAYAITERAGDTARCFVLKWQPAIALPEGLRAATTLTERLRALGYPAPRYRLVGFAPELGVAYSVQAELPGTPLGGRLDGAILDQLLALNDLQQGQATAEAQDWPRCLVEIALHGGDGFCLLEPMRNYSAATANLLTAIQQIAVEQVDAMSPAEDVVHFDFQGGNILVEGDQVTGVVDWEGSRSGDRAFDLATLFFCADGFSDAIDPAQQTKLWQALCALTTRGLRRLYLAHMIHRQVDWAIRFLGPALVQRNLHRGEEVLRLLAPE